MTWRNQDVPQGVAQDLAFGARAARALLLLLAPCHATTTAAALFAQLAICGDGGAPGQLSGIWLGLWASAPGGAAQSASMLI